MAINNAINKVITSSSPLSMSDYGTGTTSFTDHALIVGNSTSTPASLSVGTTGTLLSGTTSSAPSFVSNLDSNFTFTSATSGVNRTLTVENTDDASTASKSGLFMTVAGSTAANPTLKFTVGGTRYYSMGIDNSDLRQLKISGTATLGSTDNEIIDTNGRRTLPRQPACATYNNTSRANVTGGGTVYTIPFNTEIFDQNADYNATTYTFTAPVTGKYLFNISVAIAYSTPGFISWGGTYFKATLVTSNRDYTFYSGPGRDLLYDFYGPNNATHATATLFCDLDAADTAYVTIMGSGGSEELDDIVGSSNVFTGFSCALIC